ncbi:SGNH/GDSL hydrolase family protein [Puia sp. P3]|uniref:SGNH/GDSL hydrolase family protein n=1 Tax=Puia sp. P3 TaxID=3423952 RepID=UPI003D668AEE
MTAKRSIFRRAVYLLYVLFAVFLLLEIGLRVYNPFHFRLKGDRIVLPANQKQIITNRINPRLDPKIVNTRNSLGFRGPELPDTGGGLLKIITIGGSTTECHFLNDEKTWPYLLGLKLSDSLPGCWVNNAGLDGHSTYGHIVLLNGVVKQLRPSVVIFLTGINDVENDGPTFHDRLNTRGSAADWRHYIFENSEVLNLVLNFVRGWRAQKFNNTTDECIVLDSTQRRPLADTVVRRRMALQGPYLDAYRGRLLQLVDTCLAWHISPVLMTQPNLFGAGKDPVTHADLELYPTDPGDHDMNGKLIWAMLEQYNDVVREVCREKGILLIDLARMMPKNSLYYYDMSHFTNEGARLVAEIGSRPARAGIAADAGRLYPIAPARAFASLIWPEGLIWSSRM